MGKRPPGPSVQYRDSTPAGFAWQPYSPCPTEQSVNECQPGELVACLSGNGELLQDVFAPRQRPYTDR